MGEVGYIGAMVSEGGSGVHRRSSFMHVALFVDTTWSYASSGVHGGSGVPGGQWGT